MRSNADLNTILFLYIFSFLKISKFAFPLIMFKIERGSIHRNKGNDFTSGFVIFSTLICIRIYHECEGRIEKSVPRIAVWHHVACRVMTNGDPEGRIFLFYPHTNNGCFFLLTTLFIYLFIYLKSRSPRIR